MPNLTIAPSAIHGMGLFTRYEIESGQVFIYVFNKVAEIGDFTQDYKENMYGRYINHAHIPNARPVMVKEGIALLAIKQIAVAEEITVSYYDLISLFKDDSTVESLFRFW